jgi:hypothetical protein
MVSAASLKKVDSSKNFQTICAQINVRLEDEEWNAYRRFAQFVTWHKQMCKQDKYFGERFQLPPKKVVGKMVSNFFFRIFVYAYKISIFVGEIICGRASARP